MFVETEGLRGETPQARGRGSQLGGEATAGLGVHDSHKIYYGTIEA